MLAIFMEIDLWVTGSPSRFCVKGMNSVIIEDSHWTFTKTFEIQTLVQCYIATTKKCKCSSKIY